MTAGGDPVAGQRHDDFLAFVCGLHEAHVHTAVGQAGAEAVGCRGLGPRGCDFRNRARCYGRIRGTFFSSARADIGAEAGYRGAEAGG